MFEEKFPIDVYRFFVLLVQNDGIVFNTQFELNFLLRKNYEGQLQPDVKNSLRIVRHNHHKIMSRGCAFLIIGSANGRWCIGSIRSHIPPKIYKQMNFITQNTSKVDFWAGNGQEKLSFLTC